VNLIPEIRADVLQKSIARAHKQNILLPTFAQQKDPTLVPDAIKDRPGKPVSNHLEERANRTRRWIR